MSFTVTEVTSDGGSPRPDGFGFSTKAFDCVNTAGSTGGDIITPFSHTTDIEIVGFTPTTTTTMPGVTAVAVNSSGQVVVTIVTAADVDFRIRLAGRGM